MADWTVVPNLMELLAQMNTRFPKRDKASDGAIGNASHAARPSSHNPDKTGSPEYRDGDSKNEVRARDLDKDLKSADGVIMEQVVQHIIKNARSGKFWWIRYVIYNGRIWHKRDGFTTRKYTGANQHKTHMHVNSDFTQKADTVTKTKWLLDELGKKKPKPKPAKEAASHTLVTQIQRALEVSVDGDWGKITDGRAQLMRKVARAHAGYPRNIKSSFDIRAAQRVLDTPADGDWGPHSQAALKTWIQKFQRTLGLVADGDWGPKTDAKYLAVRSANLNKF
jgi:hypothetical protein